VDVTATKDGMVLVDWCWANDRVNKAGGGTARFGYTVEIDGTTVFDQRPSSGAGRDLIQYNWWWRRRAKKGTTVYNFYSAFRPLFRPDYDALVASKFLLPYERNLWPSGLNTNYLADVIRAAATSSTDPYWPAGLVRQQGAAGGRPEIGYKTLEQALWAVVPANATRTAELVANISAECFGVAGVYYRDYEFNRPVLADEWPRFTALPWTDPVRSRTTAESLPNGQAPLNNQTDHIAPDQQHRGAHYGLTALLSGRRLMYDALAFRSAECCISGFRWNGLELDNVQERHRGLTPDHTTGINWAQPPHERNARAQAWQMRDIVEAAYLIPSSYPRADFYRKNVEAWCAMYVGAQPLINTRMQNYFGLTITGNGSWRVTGFMYSFCFYAFVVARLAGLAPPNLTGAILDRMTDFRAGGALQSDGLARLMRLGQNIDWAPTEQGPPFPATTWAQVEVESDPPPADWSANLTEIDWQRNAINGTMMAAEYAASAEKRGMARDALVRFWSERKQPNGNPVSGPADWTFAANPQTNHLRTPSFTYDWNTAPVLQTPPTMTVSASAAAGTFIGLVDWTGPILRCTTASNATHDAFEIVSQPSGNPFTVTRGGRVLRSSTGTLTPGPQTLRVRARTISGNAPRGETEVSRWSNTVTVTINVVA
jgi:hypothetical protein